MKKIIYSTFAILTLIFTTAWGTAAIYFGDSHTDNIQTFLSMCFGLFGVISTLSFFSHTWRYRLITWHSSLFLVILFWWLNIEPSNDRLWQTDVQKTSYATFQDNLVTVHNIRNFDYISEFDYKPAYYTKTFDLNKLEGVDLFAVYWMGPAIAHTMLSFNFGPGNHLAVSIEARKEQNEGYSTIKGFFRQFELIYIVADERDIIRLRTNYRKNPVEDVYLYPLKGSQEGAKRLFLEYFKDINQLNQKPAFYNTLIENCTTTIWMHASVNPDRVPFSWKILLSGYVPEYLYEHGRIHQELPFAELQELAHINNLAHQDDQSDNFSEQIRMTSKIAH